MSSLEGFPILKYVYTAFGVSNDADLCTKMATVGLIYTIVVGIYSLFSPAPYGRYVKSTFGPTINAKLGWIVQECMSFIFPVIIIMSTKGHQLHHFPNVMALGLFLLHYFHRSFIYPLATSSHSSPAPLVTVLSATIFTSYNGLLQGLHLSNVVKLEDTFHGLIGTSLFLVGMGVNIMHDRMLISLRKETGSNTSATGKSDDEKESEGRKYKIPRGGLFEYVSGANYLGEIIEWMGFAMISREYPQIVFAIFSAVFLGIRAIHHHKFYLKTFGSSYPSSRKAIIPFIL